MKALNFKFLILGLATLTAFTSCNKGEDAIPESNSDSVIGEWLVSDGEAVAYVSGIKLEFEIGTSGSLAFDTNGKGMANFNMTFDGETSAVDGPFSWERDGFELIISSDGESRRWALVDDEKNRI